MHKRANIERFAAVCMVVTLSLGMVLFSPNVSSENKLHSTTSAVSQCNKVRNVIGEYRPVNVKYFTGTMIVYNDDFSNRFRYALRANDGFTSVYEIAEHVRGCKYKIISNDQNYITFKGDILEYHHIGSTGWVDSYSKK
ncbi:MULTISPECIES: hypothetical protein [Klebsiella]|uniref:hypothetical protein n=1 Tax=Klebsiella TaxID=570 RepID=UPI00064B7683|nr:hypothetical protein [Klebsiella aerogenes]AKK80786.1 hypothetical protein ABY61_05705 [Klebsiella aerogenes]EIW8577213.1 hypothetical protein [Klebsiella aerogenes]ELA0167357.1 hypothetical protein [Klebsiella aerogenes]ELA1993142.1 hypothetical protein [Klebsiella aerogenes]MDN3811179.1 hypothetical protein [Klebsiella aerogenes]